MRIPVALLLCGAVHAAMCPVARATSAHQAALQPAVVTPPTLAEARRDMGIPSRGDVRGLRDTVGFASTPGQMARVWELSATPPAPELLGAPPLAPVAGAICPHDDYLYAGRVYRLVLPLVQAKTVILFGVFHKYRRFGAYDVMVFDSYRAWRAADGEVAVSPLREALLARLPAGDAVRDEAAHDSEHSIEALVTWLRHLRGDIEIVPVIVPVMNFERMQALSRDFGEALGAVMRERGLVLGRDVAVVISSDAVHYGADFAHTPFGDGGVGPYVSAGERDRALLTGPLAGAVTADKVRAFFAACVDPSDPSQYRLTWCGRFAIPLGVLVLFETARALGLPTPVGFPIAYSTSVGAPELPVRDIGLGTTAPANLYHFVGYPAVAFEIGTRGKHPS